MEIKFDVSYVTFLEFENTLQKYYSSSFDEDEVCINFENIHFISLPQLCYLFGWIELLLKTNIKVKINFMKASEKLLSVIKAYGFLSSLYKFEASDQLIVNYDTKINKTKSYSQNKSDKPIVNFQTFNNQHTYRNFLKRLKPNNFQVPNRTIQGKELIDKAGVRDVLLKELGDNVFDHSKDEEALKDSIDFQGSPAFIAVSQKTKSNLLSATNPTNIINFATLLNPEIN